MSGPFLLVAFPLAMAPAVFALHGRRPADLAAALGTTVLLALMVLRLPLGETIEVLGLTFNVGRTMNVLGRSFTFDLQDRPALLYLYIAASILFTGSSIAQTGRAFLSGGLAGLGLLSAALFVDPFLFAAIFLQLVAALAVPMLTDAGHPKPRGTMRFLVFSTLGLPFILVTGWILEGSAVSPGDLSLATRATILLGIGFAILLAAIPFHTWIPELADDSPPFASAYVITILQGSTLFLLLRFLNEFEWLRNSDLAHESLRVAGLAMAVLGGVTGLVQRNFGRLMGYALIVDIGAGILAVGLGTSGGISVALVIVATRVLGMSLWAAGMSILRNEAGTDEAGFQGAAWRWPFASAAVIVGGLSIAGFPLTIGFVGRWALFGALGGGSLPAGLILLAASGGLGLAYAWGLARLFTPDAPSPLESRESWLARIVIGLGLALVLGLGLFPQWLIPAVARAALSLGNLSP